MSIGSINRGPKRPQHKITLDQAAASAPDPNPAHQECPHCKVGFKVAGLAAHIRGCAKRKHAKKVAGMSRPRRDRLK